MNATKAKCECGKSLKVSGWNKHQEKCVTMKNKIMEEVKMSVVSDVKP